MTVPVICSVCQRVFRAYERPAGLGYELARAHKGPDGKRCPGSDRQDHRPKPRKITAP